MLGLHIASGRVPHFKVVRHFLMLLCGSHILISVLIRCYLVESNVVHLKTSLICFLHAQSLARCVPAGRYNFAAVCFCVHSKISMAYIPSENFCGLIRTVLHVDVQMGWCCGSLCKAQVPLLLACFLCTYASAFVGCQLMPVCLPLARADHH